jgi:hypothetical protein
MFCRGSRLFRGLAIEADSGTTAFPEAEVFAGKTDKGLKRHE